MCNSPEQKRRKNQRTEDGWSNDVWTIKRLSKLKAEKQINTNLNIFGEKMSGPKTTENNVNKFRI